MPTLKFMRLPEVTDRVGLSKSQIYKMIRTGAFPAPIKLGPQIAVWPETEIGEWQRAVLTGAGKPAPVDSPIG